jgi:hypothetical protein
VTKENTAFEGSPVAEGSSIPFTLICAANMVTFPDILEDHYRYIPGSMCNSRSNSRRSSLRLKIDVISELRMAEEEMRKQEELMKQAIAQHISHSRGSSDELPPTETSDEFLEKSTLRLDKVADLGHKVLRLDQSELSSIEIQSNAVGHGEHLLSLLNNYEDKDLSSVLQSLPGNSIFLFPSRSYSEIHCILLVSISLTIF